MKHIFHCQYCGASYRKPWYESWDRARSRWEAIHIPMHRIWCEKPEPWIEPQRLQGEK